MVDEEPDSRPPEDQVRVRRLPLGVLPVPASGGRLTSPAGEMAQVGLDWRIRFLVTLQFLPGGPDTVRGNHVHDRREEHLYLISGRLLARFRSADQRSEWTVEMQPGDFVTVAPGVAHAYRGLDLSYAIEFSETEFDPSDTRRVALLNE